MIVNRCKPFRVKTARLHFYLWILSTSTSFCVKTPKTVILWFEVVFSFSSSTYAFKMSSGASSGGGAGQNQANSAGSGTGPAAHVKLSTTERANKSKFILSPTPPFLGLRLAMHARFSRMSERVGDDEAVDVRRGPNTSPLPRPHTPFSFLRSQGHSKINLSSWGLFWLIMVKPIYCSEMFCYG